MKFRPVFIEGRDINDTWFQLLQAAYDKGRPYVKTSGSRTGMKVYGLDYVAGFIHYPHTRPYKQESNYCNRGIWPHL